MQVHSCQVRRRILLRGLGRRPEHALLYGILWEKSDQVIVWLNHKDFQLLVKNRTNWIFNDDVFVDVAGIYHFSPNGWHDQLPKR